MGNRVRHDLRGCLESIDYDARYIVDAYVGDAGHVPVRRTPDPVARNRTDTDRALSFDHGDHDDRSDPVSHTLPEGEGLGDARGFGHGRATTPLRLETDTGLVGWGEAFVPDPMAEATVSELFADDVVGVDPFDVESLAERSYTDLYHLGEAPPFRASSARSA